MRKGWTVLLMAGLCGCASQQTEQALDAARNALADLERDPQVAVYAPRDLQRGAETLLQAERFAGYWGGSDDAQHYAYLSQRYAQIAVLHARHADVQQQVARLQRTQERLEFALHEVSQRARQQERTLEEQMIALAASETDRGLVMTLGDVVFETGSAELGTAANRTLLKLMQFLQLNPQRRIRIEGYTDNRGLAAANLALSQARAQAVADLLQDLGVAPERMEVQGYGEAHPVAENASSRGRAQNRRVEVLFSDERGVLEPRR